MASNGASNIPIVVDGDDGPVVLNSSASGISLEYVLSPARNAASPRASKFQSPAQVASPRSLEDITAKLKTAEEKRDRLMDEKKEKAKEHEKHVAEVCKMSVEMQTNEANRNLENLRRKLAVAEELRQLRLEQLVEKLKEHDNHIEEVRKRLANKSESNGDDLQRELGDATESRGLVAEAIKEKQHNGVQNGNAKENQNP